MAEHTPGPWHVMEPKFETRAVIIKAGYQPVARVSGDKDNPETQANAHHIVCCVNSHDDLVAACEAALAMMDGAIGVAFPEEKAQLAQAVRKAREERDADIHCEAGR